MEPVPPFVPEIADEPAVQRLDRSYVPEGLVMIFEGPQRVGKTMGAVAFALDSYQKGRNVFSNIQLGFPHEPLEFSEIKLEGGSTKFWNGHIFIDELNFYFDARRSISGGNVEFSAFLLQQKKQGCNLTGTTHDLMSLDVRLRNNYDFLVTPAVYPRFPETPNVLVLEIRNGPLQPRFYKKIALSAKMLMGLYDTFAIYDPFRHMEEKPKQKRGRPKSRVEL